MTIKLAHNESHKYVITMSHLVQYTPELPKTAPSDSSCPYASPGLCSCISMSPSQLPGMVSLVTRCWLRGTLITPRSEFPLGGRLGECKSREFGRGTAGSKGVQESRKTLERVPTLLRQVFLEEGTIGLNSEIRSGSFVKQGILGKGLHSLKTWV